MSDMMLTLGLKALGFNQLKVHPLSKVMVFQMCSTCTPYTKEARLSDASNGSAAAVGRSVDALRVEVGWVGSADLEVRLLGWLVGWVSQSRPQGLMTGLIFLSPPSPYK